jgi:hypothetical protein
MSTLKNIIDEQLIQALQNAETAAEHTRAEIRSRGASKYPKLLEAVGDTTSKAKCLSSMMEDSRTQYPLNTIDHHCGYETKSNDPTFLFEFAIVPPVVSHEGKLQMILAYVRGKSGLRGPTEPLPLQP